MLRFGSGLPEVASYHCGPRSPIDRRPGDSRTCSLVSTARPGEYDRERYSRRMIERILTQYGDLGVEFESDDLEYLLAKMAQLADDAREPH